VGATVPPPKKKVFAPPVVSTHDYASRLFSLHTRTSSQSSDSSTAAENSEINALMA